MQATDDLIAWGRSALGESPTEEKLKRDDLLDWAREALLAPTEEESAAIMADTNEPRRALNAFDAFLRGIGSGVAALPRGVALAAKALDQTFADTDKPLDEYATAQYADAIDKFFQEHFPGDPRLREEWFAENIPGAFGSMAAFVAGGAAGQALKLGVTLPVATMGAASGASELYQEAKALGATDDQAMKAAGIGAAVGTTEALPIGRVFGRAAGRGVSGMVGEGLKGAAEEALQEGGQTLAGNLAARGIGYDADRPVMQGVPKSMGVAAFVGGGTSTVASGLGRRGKGDLQPAPVNGPPSPIVPGKPLETPREEQTELGTPKERAFTDEELKARILTPEGAQELYNVKPEIARAILDGFNKDAKPGEKGYYPPRGALNELGIKTSQEERRQLALLLAESPGPQTEELQPEGEAVPQPTEAEHGKEEGQGQGESQEAQAEVLTPAVKPPASAEGAAPGAVAPPKPVEAPPRQRTLEEIEDEIVAIADRVEAKNKAPLAFSSGTREDKIRATVKAGLGPAGQVFLKRAEIATLKEYEKITVTPTARAAKDFDDAVTKMGDYLKGRTFSNPVDPELLRHVKNVVVAGVKYGAVKFADVVNRVANTVGSELTRRVAVPLREQWLALRAERDDLDDPSDVEEILSRREGRPELANPAITPEGRELVRDVDEARKAEGVPVRRSDVEVQREAASRIEADYDAERQRVLSVAESGGQLGDTDTVVAKQIVGREAASAIASGDMKTTIAAMQLIDAYRRTGTEQARGFRLRNDPVETPEQRRKRILSEAILTPPEKQQKAIDRARESGDEKRLRKLLEKAAKEIEDLKRRIQELTGDDLSKLDDIVKDPDKTDRVLREVAAAHAGFADKMYEFWRNAILSGPPTQIVNAGSNALHGAWYFTAERFVQSMIPSGRKQAYAQEVPRAIAGMIPALTKASRNFIRTFRTESGQFLRSMGRHDPGLPEIPQVAIRGKWGRGIRYPQRLLLAVDDFFRTLFAHGEVAALAYRNGRNQGLTGEALQRHVADETMDTDSDSWLQALENVQNILFQQPLGKAGQVALTARRDIPGLRYVVPFVTTPLNIFKTGIRKSPLGSLSLAYRISKAIRTGDWSKIPPQVAEQAIAWAVVLLLMSNDPDDPWITGSSDETKRDTRDLARRTRPALSVKVDGTWYSYARIEPFATVLGTTVDWINALHSKDTVKMTKAPLESLIGQVRNKTFLDGIADLMDIMDSEQTVDGIAQWAAKFSVSWVPNLVRHTGRATTETFPERGVWGNGEEWLERLGRRTIQQTELHLMPDQPKYDLWGRPARRTIKDPPMTDFAWRLLSPVYRKTEDIAKGDMILMAWNREHPDETYLPFGPSRSFTDRSGKRIAFTDEEYAQLVRDAGQLAAKRVEQIQYKPGDSPTKAQVKAIETAITESRDIIRNRIKANRKG